MGEVVPVADPRGLAEAIGRVLSDPARYRRSHEEIAQYFGLDACLDRYETLFADELRL
jgi:glycosyltransferase involved in cell wall biosynthesis